MLPPPAVDLSGSWVIGDPYEVLYFAGTGVLVIPPRSTGVEPLGLWDACDGLAGPLARRLGGMVVMASDVPCNADSIPRAIAGDDDWWLVVVVSAMFPGRN